MKKTVYAQFVEQTMSWSIYAIYESLEIGYRTVLLASGLNGKAARAGVKAVESSS